MAFSIAFLGGAQRTVVTPEAASTPATSARGGSKIHHWSFVIHKWTGLFAAVWLCVLGLTGFFLDHQSWRWQNQLTAPAWLTPQALEDNAKNNLLRLYQIDPLEQAHLIGGGPRGLWFSRDGGANWRGTEFSNGDHPQILAIEPDPALGWRRLWLASDNGVYVSEDGGASARPAAMAGSFVTALAAGASPNEMLGVIDRSRLFRFQTENPAKITPLDIAPPDISARPPAVPLNRFLHELHFGRGLFDPATSLLLNDIGGLGMFVLALTGLLYWGLPKYWKAQARGKDRPRTATATKRATMLWLFRLHSATLGIVAAALIIYLAASGMLIGHGKELGDWMRGVRLSQNVLPPAFRLTSWDGAIEALAVVPSRPDALILGGRIGLFSSADAGNSWTLERNGEGQPIAAGMRLRRFDDKLLIANSMSGPSLIRDADAATREVANRPKDEHAGHRQGHASGEGPGQQHAPDAVEGMAGMFMPLDVTRFGEHLGWKSGGKLVVTDMGGQNVENMPIRSPETTGVPWFAWFRRLHTGAIFWSQWRWVNDVFALAALILVITGLIRWERRKWA